MTQDIEKLTNEAIEKLGSNKPVKLDALLKVVAPSAPAKVELPSALPVPTVITDTQKAAIARLPQVYGVVLPTERRTLEAKEVDSLIEERQTLDEIEKVGKVRKDAIRTTLFNHFDVEAEKEGRTENVARDENGHYILTGEAASTEFEKKWKREVRGGSPTLTADALKALVDDDTIEFTHKDYLAMTEQVRVVDENKVMLALKKNPKLMAAIAKATTPGNTTAALYLR